MSPLYSSLVEVSEELYDKVLGVNLKGPFRLSTLIATHMCSEQVDGTVRGGSIINVSSIASQRPSPNEVVYGAAKLPSTISLLVWPIRTVRMFE